MSQLGIDSLDSKAGEVFLLHGTSGPDSLQSIIFEGLDPGIAHNGHFGRGVYFPESAAKIDQYATEDERFRKEGPLSEFHENIYGKKLHPHHVRYALVVCRVVLGRHVQTNDGVAKLDDSKIVSTCTHGDKKTHIGNILFTDKHRWTLVRSVEDCTTPSSLIAVPGKCVRTFQS